MLADAWTVVGFCVGGVALAIVLLWSQKRGWIDASTVRVRRGSGHAVLGLQEFVEPSVEYVLQAQNVEQAVDEEFDGDADDPTVIRDDLSASLSLTPLNPEEIRRNLSMARRAGLDWRTLFEGAVRAELSARPYRAPSLPPIWRVTPRD